MTNAETFKKVFQDLTVPGVKEEVTALLAKRCPDATMVSHGGEWRVTGYTDDVYESEVSMPEMYEYRGAQARVPQPTFVQIKEATFDGVAAKLKRYNNDLVRLNSEVVALERSMERTCGRLHALFGEARAAFLLWHIAAREIENNPFTEASELWDAFVGGYGMEDVEKRTYESKFLQSLSTRQRISVLNLFLERDTILGVFADEGPSDTELLAARHQVAEIMILALLTGQEQPAHFMYPLAPRDGRTRHTQLEAPAMAVLRPLLESGKSQGQIIRAVLDHLGEHYPEMKQPDEKWVRRRLKSLEK